MATQARDCAPVAAAAPARLETRVNATFNCRSPSCHPGDGMSSRRRHLKFAGSRRGVVQDTEFVMPLKLVLGAAALSLVGIAAIASSGVRAQSAREAEMIGFHQLCEKGDRKACIRFGILIGENRERHAEWRRLHPNWWWWER